MGIAIAVIYLPILGIVSSLAIFLAVRITIKKDRGLSSFRIFLNHASGSIFIIVVASIAASMIQEIDNTGFGTLFVQMAVVTLAPLVLYIIFLPFIYLKNHKWKVAIRDFCAGILYTTPVMPIAVLLLALTYASALNSLTFNKVCKNASVHFFEEVSQLTSIALLPDKFAITSKRNQKRTNSMGEFILKSSSLDFIERKTVRGSDYFEYSDYEKISLINDQGKVEYSINPISDLSVEYVVKPMMLEMSDKTKEKKIGGSKILIIRLSDNKIIASTEYYWDNKYFKVCPELAQTGHQFVKDFIIKALNIADPEYLVRTPFGRIENK